MSAEIDLCPYCGSLPCDQTDTPASAAKGEGDTPTGSAPDQPSEVSDELVLSNPDAVDVVREWLDIARKEPIRACQVLRYPPICRSEIDAIEAILSRLASQEETIRADGECLARQAKAELLRELRDEVRVHPANRLANVRRRANRARAAKVCVTCPASRHVAMMADCLSTDGYYHMLSEEPLHCATGMYSVVESLWKARAEIARLAARQEGGEG